MSGVPLVVMAGTGGAADLLVKTLRNQSGGKSKSEPTDTEYVQICYVTSQFKIPVLSQYLADWFWVTFDKDINRS